MNPLSATARTRLGRLPERAGTDRAVLHEILDEGMICHLGLIVDGSPRVIPTGYGRLDDTLYLHGSTGASSLRAGPSQDICVTVTHLDGLVLARSLFHHSINYRSAVVYGTPRLVDDPEEKLTGLRVITEQLTPGQWDVARHPNRKELAAVAVLALSLDEASVKVRQGPPGDEDEDYALDVWAGVVPVRQAFGAPAPDPLLRPGIPVPGHITRRVTS
ncbi:pyridoxamine 5'-phosphate oxidase family protein [Actinomadura sp. WMMA1423]|uniref:pyridoxamine 5'-phosphate oxidase family protein n=1 Tax=Actinomadura sp. WMMA1423 TaxID=2591108 RepID=UPI0011477A21|nr:pyridoxamine 5'-phosphate oxidase family protein [Actinomadura sp. WMMA1423]